MLSLNLSFRRLVLKYIPQLIAKDLDKYESLTAFRHQISEDIRTLSQDPKREPAKKSSTEEINKTIKKNKTGNINNYQRVQRLYIARRNYALQQGNYLQIPSSPSAFLKFAQAAINYRIVQIQTLPYLWTNQVLYFLYNFWSQVTVILAILAAIGWTSNINFPPKIISSPDTTETINVDYQYQVIATDPNIDDTLSYSFTANPGFLSINPMTGFIQGKPDTVDTGSHVVRIIVTDNNMFDLQEYTFTVSP